MLACSAPAEDDRPLLLGANSAGPLELSLRDLRRASGRAGAWCAEQDFRQGDSLLLVRLPHSSEIPLAAAAIALMTQAVRVVLPMGFDRDCLAAMSRATQCRAILWCTGDVANTAHHQVRQADALIREVAQELGLPTFSVDEQLQWHVAEDANDAPAPAAFDHGESADREVLVLSTSGSTGEPKLVRYTDAALLAVAESWQAAGLFAEHMVGGRSMCPALSHSMGFRNVLHAVWNRQPVMLVQGEWLEEKPKTFVKMLERCRPQHITCGPALLRDLALLSRTLRRVKKGLASLKCVVSSGAAAIAAETDLLAGAGTANAFGMTEVQQVLNTLLGPDEPPPGALGRPLPGVAVAVRYSDPPRRVGPLFVQTPFMASGYVGGDDFGRWFETGDLVRVEGEDVVWVGRVNDDFINTGHGVKVSLAELRDTYQRLQQAVEAILYFSLPQCGGVAAAAYVGEQDPAAPEVRNGLLQAIEADHQRLAEQRREFDLDYMSVAVIGWVAGRPPRHGPGKIDRQRALAQLAELRDAMASRASDHPHVMRVPRYGSDRPDWRRYASDT